MYKAEFMYLMAWHRMKKHADVFFFQGFCLRYDDRNNYVSVDGDIPFLLIQQIREYDPENKLELGCGFSGDCDLPEQCTQSAELDEYAETLREDVVVEQISIEQWSNLCRVKRANLNKEAPEKMYLPHLRIKSEIGLRVFIRMANAFFEKK